MTDLADILKSRGIRSVYYFHADHFEPWSGGIDEKNARGIERMAEMSRTSPFGSKLSLFYSPFVPYMLDVDGAIGKGGSRVDGDAVVFGRRSASQEKIAADVIRPLITANQHEFHLHVHHEFWTRNDSKFDKPVSNWVNANSTAELDRDRLDLFFRLCIEVIKAELGGGFDRWGFVHGNWALAGSDPLICTLENELSMIMRHGGFGDFSFPAGRGYCDPRLETPFTCLPLDFKRAYDDPLSDPRPIGAGTRALRSDRFFIWNSPIKASASSIDYYTKAKRDSFQDPMRILGEWLRGSVQFGDDLFIKTHAHSMKWEYKISEEGSPIPHCYPDVVRIFEELLRVCDSAQVEFKPVTVNEVMERVRAFDSGAVAAAAPAGDKPRREGELAVATASRASEQPAGPGGREAVGKALGRGVDLQLHVHDARSAGEAVAVAPDVAPVRREAFTKASMDTATAPEGQGVDLQFFSDEFLALQTTWMAGPGAAQQPDELYASKLTRGRALEIYEVEVASAIMARFGHDTEVVEIGSGYGALALFLARNGYAVQGFEGDRRRSAASAWCLQAYAERYPRLTDRISIAPGFFPDAPGLREPAGAMSRLGVATNITCSYSANHLTEIIEALSKFEAAVIDLGRFGRSLNAQQDRDALREQLAQSGLEPAERLYASGVYEYWLFRTRKEATHPSSGEADPVEAAEASGQEPADSSLFPVAGVAGPLYSTYGERKIDGCPVCHGSRTQDLWRIPMTILKEPLRAFDGYLNQIPTLEAPGIVYCFDFCRDCESIFLNPAPKMQKEHYRKSDHYLCTLKDSEMQWQPYESAYDRFSEWIPSDATIFLDAACGIGPYLHVARKRAAERWRRLIGLELSEKYVEYMRSQGLEAHAFDIDNDDLGQVVEAGSVDFITFCEAFEHVERPLDALKKLLAALKPGGRLYFTARRYGRDVRAAVRPDTPIYIGEKVLQELPARLGCKVVDATASGTRYHVILER